MKRKFFVFIEIFYVLIVYLVLGIGLFVWFAVDSFGENIILDILLLNMLILLPSVLLMWSIIFMTPRLEVTEQGIIKSFLGRKLKSFSWEDFNFVQLKGQFKQWVFFSKTDLTKKFLSSARCRKDNIYFFLSQSKLEKIKQVAPEYIQQQLELKTN